MTTCPSCTIDLDQAATYCGLCGRRVRARRRTLVGTRLNDRYRIDAKIAEGGFGAIYRATHVDGHEVALKVLHADLASDPSLAARFRREGATLASLRDPHTVATYDLGEAPDGTLYIAMELLHGESLLERFQTRGPLPWRKVLEIVRAVCSSLAEAHGLGIVHRDLKPANIHLAADDFVKLLDFGIAKVQRPSDIRLSDSLSGAELTRAGQAIGTLEYMSPEQIIGGACDGRSDLYALGVLAYEMITGRRPFGEATGVTSLITALMTQPAAPPSSFLPCGCIPPELDALILRCLERDAGDRYRDVHELVAAIDRILGVPARAALWPPAFDDEVTWVDAPVPAPAPRVVDPIGAAVAVAPAGSFDLAPAVPTNAPYGFLAAAPKTVLGPAPRLDPSAMPVFEVAVTGSSVRPPPRPRLTIGRVAAWAVALLASGVGLGIAIASLVA